MRITPGRGRLISRPTAISISCWARARASLWFCETTATERLLRFIPSPESAGLRGFAWADLDGDGNPDAAIIDGGGKTSCLYE